MTPTPTAAELPPELAARRDRLLAVLRATGGAAVAFSLILLEKDRPEATPVPEAVPVQEK